MLSVQEVPRDAITASQMPLAALHWPIWHPTFSREQSLGVPPAHVPFMQVLATLQRSPVSTHDWPFLVGSMVGAHWPVFESQAVVLHSLSGEKEQSFGCPTHWPTWQVPLVLQRSVGVHALPSADGVELQLFVVS